MNLLWLQSGGCGGCTLSLFCAEKPDYLTSLELAGINILYHPSISDESPKEFDEIISNILSGELKLDIFVLEGSVILGPDNTGMFHSTIYNQQEIAMKELVKKLSELADYVIAVGSCASYGGITSAGLNPSEAIGLSFQGDKQGGVLGKKYLSQKGLPVINISGCPIHPEWMLTCLQQISDGNFNIDDLDNFQRPKAISNHLVHHGCSRNEFYEYKASAQNLSQIGCMMENLGCKGTQASGDCNLIGWNGNGSCITGGYPCIACTEPNFEEPGHIFTETPKIVGIPVGLPTDMPKAWFVALSSLSKAATPERLSKNASSDKIIVAPSSKREEQT